MNITFHTSPSILSSSVQVQAEKAQETTSSAPIPHQSDQLIISSEGRDAVQAALLGSDAQTPVQTEEAATQNHELKINWKACVDPDRTIWTRAYFDALLEQFRQEEQTIRDYYAEEHAKNTSMPFDDAWVYLSHKYLDPYSSFPEFRSNMPRSERQMAYQQERSMLITGRIYTWNDPYALASIGGPKSHFDIEKTAKEAANAKIEALIQEYKAHNIPEES